MLNGGDDSKRYDFAYFLHGSAIDSAICEASRAVDHYTYFGFSPYHCPGLHPELDAMARMTATEVAEQIAAKYGPLIAAAVRPRTH
jgi:hypothetical protein